MVPYSGPRRWAAALSAHGFAGLRHQLRHDTRSRASGVSLFGQAGQAGQAVGQEGRQTPLTLATVRAAGVTVHPVPSSVGLTILK